MIQKLKIKFIFLTMSTLFVLLTIIVAGMNLMNYNSVVQEADEILSLLSQNKGMFPDLNPAMPSMPNDMLPPGFSPETPFESRYFSVFYSKTGEITQVDVSRISAVDQGNAIDLADEVVTHGKSQGFIGEYRYMIGSDPAGIRITFLDWGRKLDAYESFLSSSIVMSLLGYILVFVIISILADRIIKPIADSYEKQKRFITDAGHEIKTPLTIIQANADILEMEFEESNESLEDIKSQTKRLKTLTENLVMLSRMEEVETTMEKIEFPLSDIVGETANSFRPLATVEQKDFQCHIEPMLTLKGNDSSIRQLVSICLDNALKYCAPEGTISLSLVKQNRFIVLTVSNTVDGYVNQNQLKHVFDRFYRTDSSRNSETGGHGIGLSIAKAIVTAHDGKIKASTVDGRSFTITVTFPN